MAVELLLAQVSFVSPPQPVWFMMGGSAKSAGGESEQECRKHEAEIRSESSGKQQSPQNKDEIVGRKVKEVFWTNLAHLRSAVVLS